jgi:histidine triad (HIT) family protein
VPSKECIFCKISNKEIPSNFIFETKSIFVIKDINPSDKTHLLIIPKIHIINMASIDLENDQTFCQDFFLVTAKLAKHLSGNKSFKILCNNGSESGQIVMHLHWHFISKDDFLN